MKIISVVGARPNFLKIDTSLPNQHIAHTGQHYDYEMSNIFFKELKIPKPKWNLGEKKLGRMIDKLIDLFNKEKPDMVIVYGDTNSSLAGAVAGAHTNIQVAHVEAGLRSHKMNMPEEVNRILIDSISTILLCPNYEAQINLLKEGRRENVYVVGDPMLDAMGRFLPIKKSQDWRKYMLLTLHRNFNADSKESIEKVFNAIEQSGEKFIFPCHPRTAKNIKKFKIRVPKNIKVIQPQGYKTMLALISNAKKVLTDSGGVQREAFWMNVPVIILRNETEWSEIITKGGGILAGDNVLDAIKNFNGKVNGSPQFGANKKIKEILYKYL